MIVNAFLEVVLNLEINCADEQPVQENHQPSKSNEQTNKDIIELEEKNKQLENEIHALEEWLYPTGGVYSYSRY